MNYCAICSEVYSRTEMEKAEWRWGWALSAMFCLLPFNQMVKVKKQKRKLAYDKDI